MVNGICAAHDGLAFVEIVLYPVVDGHYVSGLADYDADELAFLIVPLTETVNLKAIHSIGQRWDDNRLGLSGVYRWLRGCGFIGLRLWC